MIYYDRKDGTAATNNLPDRFEDLPKHDIEIFQAECIQNIFDARSKYSRENNLPIEIDFILDKMNKDEISIFTETMGKDFFKNIETSYEKSDSQDVKELMEKVIRNINNKENWIALRIIEKNTTGLVGHEDPDRSSGQRSKFDALMRSVNKTEKDEAISGGTFGKGSSVYTYSSGLWMWFAYSLLEDPFFDSNNNKTTSSRLMGRGILAPYVDRNQMKTYLGHQWFSRGDNALPFINDEADKLADKFNLPIRKGSEFGTSYYIPAFQPDEDFEITVENLLKKFKLEIIKKWFIPIYHGDLICRLLTSQEDIEDIIIDKSLIVQDVPELRYKLEILDWYDSGCTPRNSKFKKIDIPVDLPIIKDFFQKDYQYARDSKIVVNQLIIREIKEEGSGFQGFNSFNRIALTRNKGMIINHYPYLNDTNDTDDNPLNSYLGERKFEAILFLGKMSKAELSEDKKNHMDLFISFAENPAHNMLIFSERELDRCRLKRFSQNPAPYPWNRINRLFKRIDYEVKKAFPKEDVVPQKKDICNFWKKLAHLQKTGEGKATERSFHYRILKEGYLNGRYYWDISVESILDDKSIELEVENYLNSLEPGKEKDFNALEIPEFKNIEIEVDGSNAPKILLEPLEKKNIKIITCDILSNELFKNYQPIVELRDKQTKNDNPEIQD